MTSSAHAAGHTPPLARAGKALGTAAAYLLLALVAVVALGPFVYMISYSLRTPVDAMRYPPTLLPNPPTLDGYRLALGSWPVWRLLWNSVSISVLFTFGMVLSCAMGAYAFARIPFRGREPIFALLLATMMVPGQVRLIPSYVLFNWLGWIDTHLPLIVPAWFAAPFGLFMLRQFFRTLPTELEDAATIDGASRLRIFWQVILPLSGPALATLAILTFMASWNRVLEPLIFINTRDKLPLTASLVYLTGQFAEAEWFVARMALSTLTVIPLVVIYFFAQRYFVRGIVLTGMK